MMKKASFVVAVAVGAALCIPTAKAQDLGGALDPVMLGQGLVLSSTMHAHAERDAARLKGRRVGGSRVGGSRSRPASSGRVPGSTRFRSSLAARRRTFASVVARTRAVNPQGAAKLQRDLAGQDPIATIAPALARYGMRTDDVADAMTVYLVGAWYGVRGSNQDPSRSLMRATRAQMSRALLSLPSFARASNTAKQQMSDTLLLQAIVTEQLIAAAKGNPTQMTRARNSIRQGALKTFKLDLLKMKLTSKGLKA